MKAADSALQTANKPVAVRAASLSNAHGGVARGLYGKIKSSAVSVGFEVENPVCVT